MRSVPLSNGSVRGLGYIKQHKDSTIENMVKILTQGRRKHEGVMTQWFIPLTLLPEQSGGVGSNLSRAPSLERHVKELRTRLALSYFCVPSAWL